MKLLLHACCGPCSLEPVRLLQDEGFDITIAFANPNIQPKDEYDHRLNVLRSWTEDENIPVVELEYASDTWKQQVGVLEEEHKPREERCRACYRLRLEQAARYAAEHGFEALSTTLAVSPYQFSQACHEELEAACAHHGLNCVWQDFRPYYPLATKRSRSLGMYRQNYCGCLYSKAEAQQEREQRHAARQAAAQAREETLRLQREQRSARHADLEAQHAFRRAAKKAYKDSHEDI